jgi:hypothetical protein
MYYEMSLSGSGAESEWDCLCDMMLRLGGGNRFVSTDQAGSKRVSYTVVA